MTGILGRIRPWLLPEPFPEGNHYPLPEGLYPFHRQMGDEHVRYHLRVDEGGPAILIAAASEAVLLSPAGAAAAKALLEGQSIDQVVQRLPVPDAAQVAADVADTLVDLGKSNVRYPIFNLADPAFHERPWHLTAPLQADVEVSSELVAREIVSRLWDARIPHVRFIVTPRSDRELIAKMVVFAEDLGMVAGVRAPNAYWLDSETIRRLAEAGLDYVVHPWGITPEWHDQLYGRGDYEQFCRAVTELRRWEVTPAAVAPLLPKDRERFPMALSDIEKLGVHHLEVFAIADPRPSHAVPTERPDRAFQSQELRQVAAWFEDLANQRRMRIVWLPPHALAPSATTEQTARMGPRTAGDLSVRIDTEGRVIPPRGTDHATGNVLFDPWPAIWNQPDFRHLRDRIAVNTRCRECTGAAVCAADCPAESAFWVFP